jgi:hypothetical protein
MKAKFLAIAGVAGLGVLAQANADEIRSFDNDRYQLIEKKGEKEVYRDKETGTKWVVEVHRKGD